MAKYATIVEGHECTVWIDEGRPEVFRCVSLLLEADSHAALERKIRDYNLAQRKGFLNPTAWADAAFRSGLPVQVEVQSITPDGREAWVKGPDGRRKVTLSTLYESRDEVLAAVATRERCNKEIEDAWSNLKRWTPIWPEKQETPSEEDDHG